MLRIGVLYFGGRQPTRSNRRHALPRHPSLLAATTERPPPVPGDVVHEGRDQRAALSSRDLMPVSRRTENVGSRFLSLLQSAALQTFSAFSGTAKKPNCRRLSRDGLGGSRAERYGQLLSEGHFLSEAWGLPDLLYKLFSERFQQLALVVKPESRNPFRLPAAIKGIAQPTASAPTSSCRHQRFAVAAPDLRTERAG
jgi:hypothetical protein